MAATENHPNIKFISDVLGIPLFHLQSKGNLNHSRTQEG